MSHLDSAAPSTGLPSFKHNKPSLLLSLNAIFRESMQKAQQRHPATSVVMRCGALPTLPFREEDMRRLFDTLLDLLLGEGEEGKQLFLFVDCEESKDHATAFKTAVTYTIKFHTNIAPTPQWAERHREALAGCEGLLIAYGGLFKFNSNPTTGCLFALTMPGKFADHANI